MTKLPPPTENIRGPSYFPDIFTSLVLTAAIALCASVAFLPAQPPPAKGLTTDCEIVNIVDGDTADAKADTKKVICECQLNVDSLPR